MTTSEKKEPETQFEDTRQDENHRTGIGLVTYVILAAVAVIFVIVIAVGFIQGISIGFLAIPINIIAFSTLSPAIRTEATSIYSLMRNLGSAIGISITGALLVSNTQINHALIAEGITPFNRTLQHGATARVAAERRKAEVVRCPARAARYR